MREFTLKMLLSLRNKPNSTLERLVRRGGADEHTTRRRLQTLIENGYVLMNGSHYKLTKLGEIASQTGRTERWSLQGRAWTALTYKGRASLDELVMAAVLENGNEDAALLQLRIYFNQLARVRLVDLDKRNGFAVILSKKIGSRCPTLRRDGVMEPNANVFFAFADFEAEAVSHA